MKLTRFDQMNLSQPIMNAIMKKHYETATQVQVETIPPMLEWQDIIAKAPTGTGKTFAFGIPIVEHIDTSNLQIQALILAPTRELAIQISTELRNLAEYIKGIRVTCIYGGQSIELQIRELRNFPQIVVATPGRLIDHLNRRTMKLVGVQTVVLDEADRMVDMGFYKDVTKILDLMPNRRNLALLSATISREVMTIGYIYQRDAVEVTVLEELESKPDILQYSVKIPEKQKAIAICLIMDVEDYKRALVFCNTKHKVEWLTRTLRSRGCSADCIHGDMNQSARERVLRTFHKGELSILVATDVASRGIDVDNIDTVFNFDIPEINEYYTHRIGRTGRAKKHGASYSFLSNYDDAMRLKEISRYTSSEILPLNIDEDYVNGK